MQRLGLMAGLLSVLLSLPAPAQTASSNGTNLDSTVVEAREAARKRDRNKLAAARAALQAAQHPLTPWVEYWDLSGRLPEAQADEVEAFYTRWRGSYVEDRLRNDWLTELGRRRDWPTLAREYPRFRMNDDREVTCWYLFTEHLAGKDVTEAARTAWLGQREQDEGCNLLATALVDAKRFTQDDVWRKARLTVEGQRPGAAKAAVALLGTPAGREAAEALDNPARFLRRGSSNARLHQELRVLATMRLAANDPESAAQFLDNGSLNLSPAQQGWAWAYAGRQAAFRLSPDAASYYQKAFGSLRIDDARQPGWSDETLAWGVRASLRGTSPAQRWPQVMRAVDAMSANEQREPAWVYWRARAQLALAKDGPDGESQRSEARRQLEGLAGALNFYATLASEDLGRAPSLPANAAPPTPAERDAALNHPGLGRALQLVAIGLRDEARREWNFSLRGMSERELLAAARLACERSDWQLCINTADRTRTEIDTALRYPMPYATEIQQAAATAGLEPALVFGLIRQETRFMAQLKSHVGATGLMQLMPATARWMAKKVGVELRNTEQINDPLLNLRLGSGYLKLVMDDLSGSQAMAAAAYNAGPGRPRRWREGAVLEAAAWAETIPLNETRDYVKKVLSNAAIYSALLAGRSQVVLRQRLGATIGPREGTAPAANTELP
jgi:soluble lytic murein transglycosylase